ncbi:MAG: pyridoxamine 5'-phosphate oxidase [Bacteroidetes bacterium]|nr:pyridoxamine 5'-phosphate oxidase [Bacteroidota bacterium]MCW5895708.1 pyridoxamine 5'-phosphate oxidase [Bacteroidota bacterium]
MSDPAQILLEKDAAANPIVEFQRWFDDATKAGIPDANAMALATATRAGKPSARIVLLKSFDDRGFCFFTNYSSEKGQQIAENPDAALVFFWQPLHRQVRIEGTIVRMTDADSDEYFRTRPRESQIGALVSPQSRVIPGREFLEERYRQLSQKYQDMVIPRPEHWGGFRLVPDSIEFWQGRENRLHDRLVYRKIGDGWRVERLAP